MYLIYRAIALIRSLQGQINDLYVRVGAIGSFNAAASSTLTVGSGAPDGATPTNPPFYWDTDNKHLYVHDGAWNIH